MKRYRDASENTVDRSFYLDKWSCHKHINKKKKKKNKQEKTGMTCMIPKGIGNRCGADTHKNKPVTTSQSEQ